MGVLSGDATVPFPVLQEANVSGLSGHNQFTPVFSSRMLLLQSSESSLLEKINHINLLVSFLLLFGNFLWKFPLVVFI